MAVEETVVGEEETVEGERRSTGTESFRGSPSMPSGWMLVLGVIRGLGIAEGFGLGTTLYGPFETPRCGVENGS